LSVLIFALFLIIFLLFTSLDTFGIWNVNMPVTKTRIWDTYSALSGSQNFILAKNWSQDPIFVLTSFLLIFSTSSEFSTGCAFHLFKLIFSMVTSFLLLSEEKISKNKKKKSKNPKKQRQLKNREERGKTGTISRGAHRERHLSCVCVCRFPPCSKSYFCCSHHLIHLVLRT